MDHLPQNSWYCVSVLWVIILTGTFTIANILSGMNPIIPILEQTYSQTFQVRYHEDMADGTWILLLSVTMSMTYVGGLVGSLLANPLLKWLARKQSLLVFHGTNTIGLILVAIGLKVAMSHEMVICGRFVVGMSAGLGMSIVPLVVNEMCVPNRRQFYGAVYGTMLPIGVVVATFFAWYEIFGNQSRLLGTLLYGIVYTVIFSICAYWIPDTPYQTYLRRGPEEAGSILCKLRAGEREVIQLELKCIVPESIECETAAAAGSDLQKEATLREILTTRQYRNHFLVVVLIFSLLMACGFSNVLSFSDKIFREAGLPPDVGTPATMGAFFISALASVGAVIAMRNFDSRSLMIVSYVVVAISHALMTTSIETSEYASAMSWVSLSAMYVFMIAYGVVTTTSFALMGVLCIDRTRSLSLLIGGACFWFFAWLVSFMAPYLTEWIQGYSFLIWMGVTLLGTVNLFFFVPQTKGKSEQEIQDFFAIKNSFCTYVAGEGLRTI